MPLKAVFFDLDDTLLATTRSRPERAQRAFERLKADHPDHPRLRFEDFYRDLLSVDYATGFIRGMRPVLTELGLLETPAGRAAHGLWFFEGCTDLIQAYPEACETLDALRRRYVLGLITNGEGVHQRRKIEALGIGHYFSVLLISGEFGDLKPSRAIFDKAVALAGVQPEEAVHVGDHLEADVWGAMNAGLRAIWFNAERRRSYWDSAIPDATVNSFSELARLLAAWH